MQAAMSKDKEKKKVGPPFKPAEHRRTVSLLIKFTQPEREEINEAFEKPVLGCRTAALREMEKASKGGDVWEYDAPPKADRNDPNVPRRDSNMNIKFTPTEREALSAITNNPVLFCREAALAAARKINRERIE